MSGIPEPLAPLPVDVHEGGIRREDMGKQKVIPGKFCYFCGDPATGMDHLPADSCFPDPKPNNLLTFPACDTHNNACNHDDDYFRLVVAGMASGDPRADKLTPKVLRQIDHMAKNRPRSLANIMKTLNPRIPVSSPGGIFLGYRPGYEIDKAPIKRVVDRIVRGLYLREHGERLPLSVPIWGYLMNPRMSPELQRTLRALPPMWYTSDNTFGYRMGIVKAHPVCSIVVLWFYECVLFISGTWPRPIPEEVRGTRGDIWEKPAWKDNTPPAPEVGKVVS